MASQEPNPVLGLILGLKHISHFCTESNSYSSSKALATMALSWEGLFIGPGKRLLGSLESPYLPYSANSSGIVQGSQEQGRKPTMPSSSLRISLVYRARDCRCTVLVAGTRSLAVVGTRPGVRNWLASAFSEEEVCRNVGR